MWKNKLVAHLLENFTQLPEHTEFEPSVSQRNNNHFWNIFVTDSAFEFYRTACIAVPIIFLIGPAIGCVFHVMIWHITATIICWMYKLYLLLTFRSDQFDVDKMRDIAYCYLRILAKIFYNHEVIGFENIPKNQPVMIIGFHGVFPIDVSCILAYWNKLRHEKKFVTVVIDKNHSKIGFFNAFFDLVNGRAWTKEELVEKLRNNESILITPGGGIEVKISDETYRLQWKQRKGFAEIALETNAIIVPYFTKNLQEAFRQPWYMEIFTMKRLVLSHIFTSIFNGLPVKLTTYFGQPISYDKNTTTLELVAKCHETLQKLIDDHQQIPGNRLRAILERFCTSRQTPRSRRRQNEINKQRFDSKFEEEFTTPLIDSV